MKLTSMTDFVLEQRKIYSGDFEDLADLYYRHAKLLKQNLELWMFFPCDEDGNVLEMPKPIIDDIGNIIYQERFKQYKQAKERCLFEGFKSGFRIPEHKVFNAGDLIFSEEENIENLLQYKNKTFTLTASVKKQLGL